jgi:hypothetical protein
VYFPGKYTDDVVITGSTPVYFVSGIYYFEKALRISGDAHVVAGAGSTPGCVESDAVAVADAINAPFDAYSNGVGATFVFGRTAAWWSTTPPARRSMKLRDEPPPRGNEDPLSVLNDVSIMSVNGVFNGTSTSIGARPARPAERAGHALLNGVRRPRSTRGRTSTRPRTWCRP